MKNIITLILMLFLGSIFSLRAQTADDLKGAWQGDKGIYTFADGYYSYAAFSEDQFEGTHGGSYSAEDGKLKRKFEFNTFNSKEVGKEASDNLRVSEDLLFIGNETFTRIDDGTPGELHGAWLITGRMRDGEMNEHTPGPRKTMKILSGERFQWIAYNTRTKEFMGTGGGTYTTRDGKYTETIDFFSRDQSRVGASLPFEYELKDGKWHHKGNSSKGEPIYEIWSKREK